METLKRIREKMPGFAGTGLHTGTSGNRFRGSHRSTERGTHAHHTEAQSGARSSLSQWGVGWCIYRSRKDLFFHARGSVFRKTDPCNYPLRRYGNGGPAVQRTAVPMTKFISVPMMYGASASHATGWWRERSSDQETVQVKILSGMFMAGMRVWFSSRRFGGPVGCLFQGLFRSCP